VNRSLSFLFCVLMACGSPSDGTSTEPTPAAPSVEEVKAASAHVSAAAKSLGGALKTRLLESMAANGPAASLEMCSQEALGMTALVAGEQHARVGRTSTRLRNPANAGPEWVTAWLESVADTPPIEITPHTAIVEVDGVHHARFVAPIFVAEPCLACHGSPAPDVADKLAALYPDDKATGYAVGELRGALWSEAPVEMGR
jgi:hypothetical protein